MTQETASAPVTTPQVRSLAGVLAVAYVAFLAFMVLWPTADYSSGSVDVGMRILQALHAPDWMNSYRVEFGLNVILFVPLSLLGSVVLNRWSWTFWLSVGFLVSFTIEFCQLVVLSARSATSSDVVANTLGAFVGAVIVDVARRRLQRS